MQMKNARPDEQQLRARSRYYFHVSNGRTFADESGAVFLTTAEALAQASTIAMELAQDTGWLEFAVLIHDDNGTEIGRVRIADYGQVSR